MIFYFQKQSHKLDQIIFLNKLKKINDKINYFLDQYEYFSMYTSEDEFTKIAWKSSYGNLWQAFDSMAN